jgi:hypothetical protein
VARRLRLLVAVVGRRFGRWPPPGFPRTSPPVPPPPVATTSSAQNAFRQSIEQWTRRRVLEQRARRRVPQRAKLQHSGGVFPSLGRRLLSSSRAVVQIGLFETIALDDTRSCRPGRIRLVHCQAEASVMPGRQRQRLLLLASGPTSIEYLREPATPLPDAPPPWVASYMPLTLTSPHDSENVVPSPEPVDGWRCTTRRAITVAAATIVSAMYGNSL